MFVRQFRTLTEVQFEGCVAELLQTVTASHPGSQMELLAPLRIVLQDALSEVVRVYPLLRLRVVVDDIKELAGIGEKVLMSVEKAM